MLTQTYDLSKIRYFDPWVQYDNRRRNLPHWRQPNVPYFVTFRQADSLPAERLRELQAEHDYLKRNKLDPTSFFEKFNCYLDASTGSCLLKHPPAANIVEQSLLHFDKIRYELLAWSIMPNHVHVLLIPTDPWSLDEILKSWKKFTARGIRQIFKVKGLLWQNENYDRIVRNQQELCSTARYIFHNPTAVGLPHRFTHSRIPF